MSKDLAIGTESLAVTMTGWMASSGLLENLSRTRNGKRGADVRPDFNWNKPTVPMMGNRTHGP
jgi:hypothetical protein